MHSSGPILVRPPAVLSFSRNSEATIAFFDELKTAIFTPEIERRKGETQARKMNVVLSCIRDISLPCAVILGAELKRWAAKGGFVPRLSDINRMSPKVISILGDMGILAHLGIPRRKYLRRLSQTYISQISLVEMTSAELQDAEKVSEVQRKLGSAISGFARNPRVHRVLLEATANAIEHAYKDGLPLRFPPGVKKGRWYATASYDASSRSLRFFVYDQGAGIPASINSKPKWYEGVRKLGEVLGLGTSDADLIHAAFEMGRSSTQMPERGKGLQDIQGVIEVIGAGYLRVLSGRGDLKISDGLTVEKQDHGSHIGGTLLEWSLPLDAVIRKRD